MCGRAAGPSNTTTRIIPISTTRRRLCSRSIGRAKIRKRDFDFDEAIARGREWIAGLQSKNGGWGAFDADNSYDYLNNIPFADHGALLDPPTADVSGRCLGALAQLGASPDEPEMKAAIAYLRGVQEKDGSWFGRWGVNYIYGTWSALAGLNAAGVGPDDPAMRRAAEWLIAIQNDDGGWGEDCQSYKLDYKGYEPAPSTASQTAWALLALMAAGETGHQAVALRNSLFAEHARPRWAVAAGSLYRRRLPARVLSALPRLPEIFSALGAGALPQFDEGEFTPCRPRAVDDRRRLRDGARSAHRGGRRRDNRGGRQFRPLARTARKRACGRPRRDQHRHRGRAFAATEAR